MPRLVALLAVAFVCAGCQTRVTHYTMLSTRQLDVSSMKGLAEEAGPVEGASTRTTLGVIPLSVPAAAAEVTGKTYGSWNLGRAMNRALARSPGAVGMSDVVVHDTVFSVPFLVQYHACKVRGRPLIDAPSQQRTEPDAGVASLNPPGQPLP